ncbi:kynureninase [Mucilaginibacter rubeus]|uniref:Kynureninase n=1 Tax=Mucilaginibacter rubeus TaxID=2027860 RepID=A0AAE6MHU5_9SPHI|nr:MULTISPECIES: kynureninase [Mucilaginibacter]QEM03903.1 kynureninase [Mucilaginibacter rubeus]QEM16513.1 kynureninase [Mucilaginibacter gossypii]QTE40719.1 kynureninase [Mucilaginibacter rubeus]QTE47321.1 kynureninase [Mucilaginibacter rubeus]QTE58714.1 kynureninase [Mucilaginibacter rubeus]
MNYQNDLAFARRQDEQDSLKNFRSRFLIPQHNGEDAFYLCGNSLGLQPVSAQQYLADQLNTWKNLAVEGWFQGDEPWLDYHKQLIGSISRIVGANENEVAVMNSLTVNLHLLLVSFYQPNSKRFKIIMEGGAFPSDQYAIESQVKFHALDPKEAIIEIFPREGEVILRTEDILKTIDKNKDELALVLFGGINYYTGQFFDLKAITDAAHAAGAYAGFDLAHAAGNVPLQLHDWGADFACWCSYKYMNSGPGGISGIFVHERHFTDKELNRFAGWWGYRRDKQFLMAPGFDPEVGAAGWQVSTSPIPLLALFKASMAIFDDAGGLGTLRQKSIHLTGYLEFLIQGINKQQGEEIYRIITPADPVARGCQLSVVCKRNAKVIFNYLAQNGVIGDWREPDVIRLSPVPLYNTFEDVYQTARLMADALKGV